MEGRTLPPRELASLHLFLDLYDIVPVKGAPLAERLRMGGGCGDDAPARESESLHYLLDLYDIIPIRGAPHAERLGGTVPPRKNWRVYICYWIFMTLHPLEGRHIRKDRGMGVVPPHKHLSEGHHIRRDGGEGEGWCPHTRIG